MLSQATILPMRTRPAAHKKNPFPVHTTPQGNVAADTRQDLKEPPQEVSRIGKTHRNQ